MFSEKWKKNWSYVHLWTFQQKNWNNDLLNLRWTYFFFVVGSLPWQRHRGGNFTNVSVWLFRSKLKDQIQNQYFTWNVCCFFHTNRMQRVILKSQTESRSSTASGSNREHPHESGLKWTGPQEIPLILLWSSPSPPVSLHLPHLSLSAPHLLDLSPFTSDP